jgi:hypothetical protein
MGIGWFLGRFAWFLAESHDTFMALRHGGSNPTSTLLDSSKRRITPGPQALRPQEAALAPGGISKIAVVDAHDINSE